MHLSDPFTENQVRAFTVIVLCGLAAGTARSQQPLVGYTAASAARERQLEADAIARPSPDGASKHSKELSHETHVSGTTAQARTRDYVIAQMKAWGLETEIRSYDVWMPHPTSVRVSRVSPQPKELSLAEPPVATDPTSKLAQYPTVNGYIKSNGAAQPAR